MQATELPAALCISYYPRYPDYQRRRLTTTAFALLNAVITREAFARALSLIDLRVPCNQDPDFANPIKPSVQGRQKMADAIATFLHAPPEM